MPKSLKDRPFNSNTMTNASFFGMIRSALRRLYMIQWKAKGATLRQARRVSKLRDARIKWEYNCAICDNWYTLKEVQVDHIEPCGTLRSFDALAGFCKRLFVETHGLRVLCVACHNKVTHDKA